MHAVYSAYSIQLVVVLLLIAAAVAIAVKWIKVPYSIALVIVGLFIGVFRLLPVVNMTPELIMLVFLPPLLFEASWSLDLHELKANWLTISVFAVVGVVLSMVITGYSLNFISGLDLLTALTFGAMVAATDPVSVLAVFRKLSLDKRLIMLLEGESLFNDGTAVVLFTLTVASVASVSSFSLPLSIGKFLGIVLGGTTFGLVIGWLASKLHKYLDDHVLETMLTMVVAYGSFLIADHYGLSPVLTVITSGIVLGNSGRDTMSERTLQAVDTFWEFAAFVVNSLVFLLIGMQVHIESLQKHSSSIFCGIVAMLVARLVVVYSLSPCASFSGRKVSYKWRALLFWGALRGSLSMAMALSLPVSFPQRETLIVITFGAVLFTLIAQGLTIEPLINMLKLKTTPDDAGSSAPSEV